MMKGATMSADLFNTLVGMGVVFYFVGMIVGGYYVAEQKGRAPFEGMAFSVLLGPIGMIIVACLPTLEAEEEQAPCPLSGDGDRVEDSLKMLFKPGSGK
jgi:hypothetical protein